MEHKAGLRRSNLAERTRSVARWAFVSRRKINMRSLSVVLAFAFLLPHPGHAQLSGQSEVDVRSTRVVNNSAKEMTYLNIVDAEGKVHTAELRVAAGGEVWYDEQGNLAFGKGQHKLVNVDGKGQYIALSFPSAESNLLAGFRVDQLDFHFEEKPPKYVSWVIDRVKPHDKTLEGNLLSNQASAKTGFQTIDISGGNILLRKLSAFPFVAPTTLVDAADRTVPVVSPPWRRPERPDAAWSTIVVDGDGKTPQTLVGRLVGATSISAETYVRKTIVKNSYKPGMRLVTIRDRLGNATSYILQDKGTAAYVDEHGHVVYATGSLRLKAVDDAGQVIAGWLAKSGKKHLGKRVDALTIYFDRTQSGGYVMRFRDIVEHRPNTARQR
jgi:hypothetical protein